MRVSAGRIKLATLATFFDEYQRQLYERQWTWDDIPFYEGKGAKQSRRGHNGQQAWPL